MSWLVFLTVLSLFLAYRRARLLPFVFLMLGCTWATLYASHWLATILPPQVEGKTITVVGRVLGLPQRKLNRLKFHFEIQRASVKGRDIKVPARALLSYFAKSSAPEWDPDPGSVWRLKVRLKNPHGFKNPGGFDYESYLFSQHILATGYVVPKAAREHLGDTKSWLVDRYRKKIRDEIGRLELPTTQAAVLTALSVGDKQQISQDQWKVFRKTGTSHLMAISGLHLSLVSGLVFLLSRFAWSTFAFGVRRLPAQKFAALPALSVAIVYSALAGFSVPTQRALVMLSVFYFFLLISKQHFRISTLAIALIAVLLIDPLSVLSPSFWLSFSAVALIVFVISLQTAPGKWYRAVAIQAILFLGLFPLTLTFFQYASLVSPIANFIVVPVYSLLVVPLTLLGLIIPGQFESFFLAMAGWLSGLCWHYLNWLSGYSFSTLSLASPGILVTLTAMFGVVMIFLPLNIPLRILGSIFWLPLFWHPSPPPEGSYRATVLDVGQGLSVVVQTHSHAVVFDTGARFSNRLNAGEAVVVPYLHQLGITKLDALVISHDDNDHIGGLRSVRAAIQVRQILSNVKIANPSAPCSRGKSWSWDKVRFEILHPGPGTAGKTNNHSCVLIVRGRKNSLLLPGDIEKSAEQELVREYGAALHASFLVAPHHGSRTSSSPEFLRAVKPSWVIVPAGHLNKYHHPSQIVINRYNKLGIHWLVSGEQGAIEINTNEPGTSPVGFRVQNRRFWEALPRSGKETPAREP